MKNWYSVKNLAEDSTEISIYDEIGMWGVTAKDFISDLKSNKGKKVTLSINSPGGSVFDALAIYNALRSHGSDITVKVIGVAASAASLIAMAGDKIIMPENTFMMIHNPISGVYGNAGDMREIADTLDKIAQSLIGTYVARTGLTEGEVKDLLDAESWLSAEEAVALGFADEMEEAFKVAAVFDTSRIPSKVMASISDEPTDEPTDEPADEPTDEPSEEDIAAATQIAEMRDHIVSAGFESQMRHFMLSYSDMPTLSGALKEAKEIRDLCAFVKADASMTNNFITAKISLSEVRARLCEALAEKDEELNVNTFVSNGKPPTVQSGAIKTAEVWAARNVN